MDQLSDTLTQQKEEDSNPSSSEAATDTVGERSSVDAFSNRIALVTQARTVAGMLTLLRILVHEIVQTGNILLYGDVLIYQNRDTGRADETGKQLFEAAVNLVTASSTTVLSSPDLYDAMVSNLQLLLVLFSDQLYAPPLSSFQRLERGPQIAERGMFWDYLKNSNKSTSLIAQLLEFHIKRHPAPERSISIHHFHLAETLAHSKNNHPDVDGLYSTHQVVAAARRKPSSETNGVNDVTANQLSKTQQKNVLLDATKGVLVLSSSIILLPFRLVSLALHLFGPKDKKDMAYQKNKIANAHPQRVKHVLWVSDSIVADIADSLVLLWLNNDRALKAHPLHDAVRKMTDNRWNELPDLPPATDLDESQSLIPSPLGTVVKSTSVSDTGDLTVNFESLFESFGSIAHTEPGALLLYSILQTCPAFSEYLAVRSDLDTIVIPMLRTLYTASSLRHFSQADYQQNGSNRQTQILNCPFRSPSQLYLIVILLLLFSQDVSFGTDAFRRVAISKLPWYQERKLQDIRLGSVLILILLRLLTFNVNRLQDAFLLGNACAVLENLAPSVVDLHEYSAMRLCAVTISSLQRFEALRKENPEADLEDLTAPIAMHAEISRTLLRVWHCALGPKAVGQNLYLIYALIYHQSDWRPLLKIDLGDIGSTKRIDKILTKASSILKEQGDSSRTAAKALGILQKRIDDLEGAVAERRRKEEDFTFTYEEEADPEIFFVPYTWEVVVSAVTSGTLDWHQDKIRVFALLDKAQDMLGANGNGDVAPSPAQFSQDVSDVV